MDALIALPILKALVLAPVTLLPIINPLRAAPIFVATFGGDRALAARLARQIAISSWFVIVVSMRVDADRHLRADDLRHLAPGRAPRRRVAGGRGRS